VKKKLKAIADEFYYTNVLSFSKIKNGKEIISQFTGKKKIL
jgi:hypothetical protein